METGRLWPAVKQLGIGAGDFVLQEFRSGNQSVLWRNEEGCDTDAWLQWVQDFEKIIGK